MHRRGTAGGAAWQAQPDNSADRRRLHRTGNVLGLHHGNRSERRGIMNAAIPRGPLILGLAGLLPFYWGAATLVWPELGAWGIAQFGSRFVGPYVQLFYGAVILSFMSGVLWGFAAKTDGWVGYALSVIPALWAFFMTGGGPVTASINLIAGFLGLLLLDAHFAREGLAPGWWMRLRVVLTTGVVIALLPGAL